MNTIMRENMSFAEDEKRNKDGIEALPFVQSFLELCEQGAALGFHERNGGNLSYWLTREDASLLPPCPEGRPWFPLQAAAGGLGGEFFMVTATGSYMRGIRHRAAEKLCVLELDAAGAAYRVVWGLEKGGRPTSELESHLLNFNVRAKDAQRSCRVMYHAHPKNVIAMTYLLPLTAEAFTRALWTSMTECPFIFPDGVGVLPWMLPGGAEIGRLTAQLMEKYDVVVWAHHGVFCCGKTFEEAFGLMETIEKSADIYMLLLRSGLERQNTMDDAILRRIAGASGGTVRLDRAGL